MKWKLLNKKELQKLPTTPGVYYFKNNKESFLYIGKAANLRIRVKNHFQQPSFRDNLFIGEVRKIGYLPTSSEIEALLLESQLIKKCQPRYNVLWRDDKKYFYVVVTQEKLPRVLLSHQPNPKEILACIGPFTDGKAIKKTLRLLRKIFPYYTNKNHPQIKCIRCYLGLCPGPNPNPKEYSKNIQRLIKILQGKTKKVLVEISQKMLAASSKKEYEKAAILRDQLFYLENVFEHAKVFSPTENLSKNPSYKKTEKYLQKIFKTKHPLSRLEAYDVSNIQGQQATASMVVFIKGKPAKNLYRKFKIKISGKPNDPAMIKEAIARRLKHSEWGYPHLMIIDGGKTQLNATLKALKEASPQKEIKVAALAKKRNELFLEGVKKPILLKEQPQEIAHLILFLRDESHRFAKSYHLKLRSKAVIPK